MRRIRVRPRVPLVMQALAREYVPGRISFEDSIGVYIVKYRGRKIAFSERGGLIAVGPANRLSALHINPFADRLVSQDILAKADRVMDFLAIGFKSRRVRV